MVKPKVLYSFCGTGQGHMAKADALKAEMNKRYDVEFLASSLSNPLLLNVEHKLKGATLVFDDKARLDIPKTFWAIDAKNYIKEAVNLDLSKYDFIINDHETVTSAAAWINDYKNIFTFSHQAAFRYKETPRAPVHFGNFLDAATFDFIIRGYAPNLKERSIGVHFDRYHENIAYPLLRQEILDMNPTEDGSCLVYLPKDSKEFIYSILSNFPKQKFCVFDPRMTQESEEFNNITFFKTDKNRFMTHLSRCSLAIINSGFELPSELIYLGKKFLAIPQNNHYEQECNAAALDSIGVSTSMSLNVSVVKKILNNDTIIHGQFLSTPSEILDKIESKLNNN